MPFDPTIGCDCQLCQPNMTQAERDERDAERADEERRRQRRARDARRRETLAREAAREAERERLDTLTECAECGDEHPLRGMVTVGTEVFCTNHAALCNRCTTPRLIEDLTEFNRGWDGTIPMCEDCTRTCEGCDETHPRNDMYRIGGVFYCADCATYCDDCDRYYYGDDCSCDSQRVRGLSGYGKTQAMRWLGGPVPKDKGGFDVGYYLGFELEITAHRGNVRVIHDWARDNLGFDDGVDCKEDSSVEGFEIATQPMTPEFFESVKWESFFDMLNDSFPLEYDEESDEHGLHVHIGRTAFAKDDIATAAFCYLLGQSDHLVRIARRSPTTYCRKVNKPVSAAIKQSNYATGRHPKQARKTGIRNVSVDRDAINLLNSSTIEIRAFRSTRSADDLRAAVRLVYVAAEYIRFLRKGKGNVSPRALHWGEFAKWVGKHYPQAFESIAGITDKKVVR